jgi:hypothetical protein
LCDNASGGEKRQGFVVGVLASEGQVVDAAGLRATIARWLDAGARTVDDAYGPGGNRLFSIGCPAGIVPCGNQFVLVFSQRQPAVPARIELLLYFERSGTAQPALVYLALGPLLEPAQEQAALRGGAAAAGFLAPQGWPPIQAFYRYSP